MIVKIFVGLKKLSYSSSICQFLMGGLATEMSKRFNLRPLCKKLSFSVVIFFLFFFSPFEFLSCTNLTCWVLSKYLTTKSGYHLLVIKLPIGDFELGIGVFWIGDFQNPKNTNPQLKITIFFIFLKSSIGIFHF